jgi:hypothetical protein
MKWIKKHPSRGRPTFDDDDPSCCFQAKWKILLQGNTISLAAPPTGAQVQTTLFGELSHVVRERNTPFGDYATPKRTWDRSFGFKLDLVAVTHTVATSGGCSPSILSLQQANKNHQTNPQAARLVFRDSRFAVCRPSGDRIGQAQQCRQLCWIWGTFEGLPQLCSRALDASQAESLDQNQMRPPLNSANSPLY